MGGDTGKIVRDIRCMSDIVSMVDCIMLHVSTRSPRRRVFKVLVPVGLVVDPHDLLYLTFVTLVVVAPQCQDKRF